MRLLLLLSVAASCVWAEARGYEVVGEPQPWATLFESIGQKSADGSPAVLVLRTSAQVPNDLLDRVKAGLILVIEANTGAYAQFGIQPTGSVERVRREADKRVPDTRIVWQQSLTIPRVTIPSTAEVFSKDYWSGIPLMAGWKVGNGAVLWLAAPLTSDGYGRFPLVLDSLRLLGITPPIISRPIWAFLDYSYRSRTSPEYMAATWRKMGISGIFLSAWYFNESDKDRDAWVSALIEACHRHAIQVHAWFEFPHVSDQFWSDHPQCREKTAQLSDATVFWRKLMNFVNPSCVAAVEASTAGLLNRFDWDGAMVAELYFESLLGPEDPSQLTPMNDDFRKLFQGRYGFDPVVLFDPQSPGYLMLNSAGLQQFYDLRADLNYEMNSHWLKFLQNAAATKNGFATSLLTVDDLYDPSIRNFIGYDAKRLLPLLDQVTFQYIVEDPATLWTLGPDRYRTIGASYRSLTSHVEKLGVDINIATPQQIGYPTERALGSKVTSLAEAAAASFPRVMYYSESSIDPVDRALLPSAATPATVTNVNDRVIVSSAQVTGIPWEGPALVDGTNWPFLDGKTLWLPEGTHVVEKGGTANQGRLTDFNGALKWAERPTDGSISIWFESITRAYAVVDLRPTNVWIDGRASNPPMLEKKNRYTIVLPSGVHAVTISFD